MEWVWLLLALASQALARPQPPQRPGQMPTLPLTQLDERALAADLDARIPTISFAQPIAINDLLLVLVRGTNLSVIADPSIGGSFIGELKNVTVRQALDLILPALGLDYRIDESVIHVFKRQPQTRMFDVNYIATQRMGDSSIGSGGDVHGVGRARVASTTSTDMFGDLARGVQGLLSSQAAFNLDRKAGLLQVTDFPERLDRVASYLDAVHDRVHRQVQIDARLVEVELADAGAAGLDWTLLADARDLGTIMTALSAQGKATVVAAPRLFALNNEPAILRTGALTLSVTPQIATNAVVMLSLSSVLPSPASAEADTLARVADGETVVVSGFSFGRDAKRGWFGRSAPGGRRHVELVVLFTPRILTRRDVE